MALAKRVAEGLSNHRLTGSQIAKFTAMVALMAILADATIGHGLTWENDPYWTYWVTKTFLIATVFGLGTAWFGIGVGRGAVITAVHTLILTVYYWALSPIGLPSSPNWLDLEHTWISGVPIHFGVIYLGYLTALWIWRRAHLRALPDLEPTSFGFKVLIMSLLIVIFAGGLSNLALGEFAGITWFVVRLLITVPFILIWRSIVGRDMLSSVVGGLVLALIWAAYSQYLGPTGLPDIHNLRIFTQAPPPSPVHWLNYNQLWLISLPIYIVSMISLLILGSYQNMRLRLIVPLVISIIATAAVTLAAGLAISKDDKSGQANIKASGITMVEKGTFYSNQFQPGTGRITLAAKNSDGGRGSPLPPHDEVNLNASVQSGGHNYVVTAKQPLVNDPLGQFSTSHGVGLDVKTHGRSGVGSSKLPNINSKLSVSAIGELTLDGQLTAVNVPVHVFTAEEGLAGNSHLDLEVGDYRSSPLQNLPTGHLRALWSSYQGKIPGPSSGRYIGGDIVLAVLLIGGLWINRFASPMVSKSKAGTTPK